MPHFKHVVNKSTVLIELLWCKKNLWSLWLIVKTIDTDKSFFDIYLFFLSGLANDSSNINPQHSDVTYSDSLSGSINYHKLLFNESTFRKEFQTTNYLQPLSTRLPFCFSFKTLLMGKDSKMQKNIGFISFKVYFFNEIINFIILFQYPLKRYNKITHLSRFLVSLNWFFCAIRLLYSCYVPFNQK